MRTPLLLAATLAATLAFGCAPAEGLVFSPERLDFGEVDFAGELPEDGYASESVSLANAGKRTVAIALPAFDDDRLCLAGFDGRDFPVELGELAPDAAYTFVVGVCGYVSGEVDSSVTTELVVDGSDGPVALPITFTPIRSSG